MSAFDEESVGSPEADYYFYDDKSQDKYVCMCEKSSERLNSLREKEIDWEVKGERDEYLRQLYPVVENWKGPLPNLRDIFGREKIDRLLMEYVKNKHFSERTPLLEFVINTGYTDEPKIDEDGKPSSRRTTAVHHAAECPHNDLVGNLFKIYDRFDVNYVNESGLTHFHVACMSGCHDVVEKFLALGQDPNFMWQETGDSALHLALAGGHNKVVEMLLRHGADPNSANVNGKRPLHLIYNGEFDDDLVEVFFKICDEKHQLVRVDAVDNLGRTLLHYALLHNRQKVIELLLRRGSNPNSADGDGWTPLHIICNRENDDNLAKIFFDINDEKRQLIEVNAQNNSGQTPLFLAIFRGLKITAESLLKRGADPNLSDRDGWTPLHMICRKKNDADALAKMLFEISDENHQLVQVNVRDKKGRTPLHWALHRGFQFVVELLLKRGADSNVIDEDGATPLHPICNRVKDDNLYQLFFKINEEIKQSVQINVVNKKGQTPLHLALGRGHKNMVESLLRRGADPNVACAGGYTPLHTIIRFGLYDFVETFFKINDELNQSVQVDVVDESGHTPLQSAVARLSPDTVDFLLDRGAKLSSFVFPTEDQFDECLVYENVDDEDKLEVASSILAIVDSLEKRGGYELGRRDALMVMKLFSKTQVFDESMTNLEDHWYADEDFAVEANKIMISPSLSLFDLIHHRPEETSKLLTYLDYNRFANSSEWEDLPEESCEPCSAYLCEIMSRGFLRRWALEFFLTLTNYRLPILCCDMIIKNLKNADLLAICLAASDQVCDE